MGGDVRADVCASPCAQAAELRLSCDVPGDVSEDQLREKTCKGKEGAGGGGHLQPEPAGSYFRMRNGDAPFSRGL